MYAYSRVIVQQSAVGQISTAAWCFFCWVVRRAEDRGLEIAAHPALQLQYFKANTTTAVQ